MARARRPTRPARTTIGEHAARRITDAADSPRPVTALRDRAAGYLAGDTDLAWTRLTTWRTLLTSILDEPADVVTVSVAAPRSSASAALLAAWLRCRLQVPVAVVRGQGPEVAAVSLGTPDGPITVRRRPDSRAHLVRPGRPDVVVALPERDRCDLLAEELRRLDPDPVYGEALAALSDVLPTVGEAP